MCVLKLESDINTHDFITDKKRERERETERCFLRNVRGLILPS